MPAEIIYVVTEVSAWHYDDSNYQVPSGKIMGWTKDKTKAELYCFRLNQSRANIVREQYFKEPGWDFEIHEIGEINE